MRCDWCSACDGEGEFSYEGWVLARPEGASWLVFPWRGGLGGASIQVLDGDVPEEWLSHGCVAANVEMIADGHAVKSPMEGLIIDSAAFVPAERVSRLESKGDEWRASAAIAGVRRLAVPEGVALESQTLASAPVWVWEAASADDPSWQFEDALGFLAPRITARAPRRWRKQHHSHFAGRDAFVNPYNFVPLGSGPKRREPTGHLGLADGGLSGQVYVRWTAHTSLALSGSGTGRDPDNAFAPMVIDGEHTLAGSQLAGAVRAFHEALTDSCLRVVDLNYAPVHRDLAQAQEPGRWRMAVVDGPAADEVLLCHPIHNGGEEHAAVWIEARKLAAGAIDSGQLFHFDLATTTLQYLGPRSRMEWVSGSVPVRCVAQPGTCNQDHWRTIVTEAVGLRRRNPGPNQHPYHLPFARVSTDRRSLSEAARKGYRQSAHDAGDVVKHRRGEELRLAVPGIGTRQETTEEITQGQVVWVELDHDEVAKISRSVLWRSPGTGRVKDRIGVSSNSPGVSAGYEPCSDPGDLCPSCRLFGMVEERMDRSNDKARVAAYRGHVRFGLAIVSEVDPIPVHMRELGAPRPSAGQFYLRNGKWTGKQAAEKQRPLREWGSAADQPTPRQIAGRKFYWTTSPGERHLTGDNSNPHMTSYHKLTPPGATVTFPVWFDNLTPVQLGSLLVSLDPNLLRAPDLRARLIDGQGESALGAVLESTLGLHLGKGKGVGLGAVMPHLSLYDEDDQPVWPTSDDHHVAMVMASGEERYTTTDEPVRASSVAPYVEQFVNEILDSATRARWSALLALTAVDWVPPNLVDYPPDDVPGAKFQFNFWQLSSGAPGTKKVALGNGQKSVQKPPLLVSLPAPDAVDVTVKRPWLEDGR